MSTERVDLAGLARVEDLVDDATDDVDGVVTLTTSFGRLRISTASTHGHEPGHRPARGTAAPSTAV